MNTKHLMAVSRGKEPAEKVFKNAQIINVYSGEIETADIAVEQGTIVGIGEYTGKTTIDCSNQYVAPGFIDGHVHIESSMLTPPSFAEVVVPKGTTTVIADPHEIANISGVEGIKFMLKSSRNLPLNVHMMLPSCVPATSFENAGATITKEDIEALKDEAGVLGLGEVMDYPAVLEGDANIHDKIRIMQPRVIDGHAPDVVGNDLNAYILAGVQTDHESTMVDALLARIRRGMYVHLREGSATHNVEPLLKAVNARNLHRILFCTDDKHPEDIKHEGHINHNINIAIKVGIDPLDAIRMGTINAAQAYRLDDVGAIAPGKRADLVVFDSLDKVEPHEVYKDGTLVAKDGKALFSHQTAPTDAVNKTVHVDVDSLDFSLKLKTDKARVIAIIPKNITTKHEIRSVKRDDKGYYVNDSDDLLKIAVIERHKNTGNVGIGLVEGFGLKNGALAMSIAHDSHNIIVVGDSDASMHKAVEAIDEMQGGIALVKDNKLVDRLTLEIGGIMTNLAALDVQKTLERMRKQVKAMGLNETIDDPFITLAFLALPVIPALKITDTGLFDVEAFTHIAIDPT